MRFHQLNDTTRLEVGAGQVQQPTEAAPEIALKNIDLFLVPLAACDMRGNRLGFGRGYYDRVLANSKGFKLGVGFRCQLLEDVPFESHDIPLDGFISEEGLIRF
ncbi:MAG: 5-formyltetrahydrofolate cyclo-ligase [Halieaceae bacterium]|jgi:5-formyltetrahydrofolate cyclo-ligase|nr:MAG: 5-formyltetrahydrofolate cyclo-ligase [Halieaceae bacterium]